MNSAAVNSPYSSVFRNIHFQLDYSVSVDMDSAVVAVIFPLPQPATVIFILLVLFHHRRDYLDVHNALDGSLLVVWVGACSKRALGLDWALRVWSCLIRGF